ncbi:unnamed protein product, partial [Dibothriocephalus latus]
MTNEEDDSFEYVPDELHLSNVDESDDVELLSSLAVICKQENLLLLDDFNAPGIDWMRPGVKAAAAPFNYQLLQFYLDEYLIQHIEFTTRLR